MPSKSQARRLQADAAVAYDLVCEGARLAFLYGYVPLIIWLGSSTTEGGLLNALFPPEPKAGRLSNGSIEIARGNSPASENMVEDSILQSNAFVVAREQHHDATRAIEGFHATRRKLYRVKIIPQWRSDFDLRV